MKAGVEALLVAVLRYFGGLLIFCLMVLTCVDVFGRYVLDRPLIVATELTEVLLSLVIYAGLPLVALRNAHVTVDLFDPITPRWLFRLQHVAAAIIGALCTFFIAWRLWVRAVAVTAAGESTPALHLKLGWVAFVMSALMAGAGVALVVLATRAPSKQLQPDG